MSHAVQQFAQLLDRVPGRPVVGCSRRLLGRHWYSYCCCVYGDIELRRGGVQSLIYNCGHHFGLRCGGENVFRILHAICGSVETQSFEQPFASNVRRPTALPIICFLLEPIHRVANSDAHFSHLRSLTLASRYISRNNFYVLNALPSTIDNTDSRITSDSEQMFREFFNVVAIFLTQATLLIAVSAQVFQRSQFVRAGVLAQVCFACICLPLAKRSVGPVTSAVYDLKQRDGNFNFQVGFHGLHAMLHFSTTRTLTPPPALQGQKVLRKHRILCRPSTRARCHRQNIQHRACCSAHLHPQAILARPCFQRVFTWREFKFCGLDRLRHRRISGRRQRCGSIPGSYFFFILAGLFIHRHCHISWRVRSPVVGVGLWSACAAPAPYLGAYGC